jgi:antirestriction protein ArdC
MNVYEIITNKIIEQLEKGTVPWQRPWKTGLPKNLVTKHEYRGVNVLVLGIQTYSCPYWATFKQIKEKGGTVKKGASGTPVIYWSWINKTQQNDDDRTEDGKEIPLLKYYTVFNIEQTEGIEIQNEEPSYNGLPDERCETIIAMMPDKPMIKSCGHRAFYRPPSDEIQIPAKNAFGSAEQYYATLFHELVHSTGHERRLNRPGITEKAMFGSEKYSKEELVAEIGAAFLCGSAGIENKTIENSAAYIANWLEALKNDRRLVVLAAANAQKAVDYIRNEQTTQPE